MHIQEVWRPWLFKAYPKQFKAAGYSIVTKAGPAGRAMRLVEVYPHSALLTLLGREYRVPYKVAKSHLYWHRCKPKLTIAQRIATLLNEFRVISEALVKIVGPVALPLPQADAVPSLAALKRYEDAVDALVCARVGICYLEGSADAYGDETAAIWCPTGPRVVGATLGIRQRSISITAWTSMRSIGR